MSTIFNKEELIDAINLVNQFSISSIDMINSYYCENEINKFSIVISDEDKQNSIATLDGKIKKSIDSLSERLDHLNYFFMLNLNNSINTELDTVFYNNPLERVGIYAPYRMPSTVYTFLSAAKAAGVKELVVFLPVNKHDKKVDSASMYAAQKYGAEIICGPAKYGFPLLAFGINTIVNKCDKICGPCGTFLNQIKQISSIIAGCDIDMAAGPSELVIITDNNKSSKQIEFDLLSQLEHGPDSKAYLVKINVKPNLKSEEILKEISNEKIIFKDFSSWDEGIKWINTLAPETVVAYTENTSFYKEKIISAGVLYVNCINSLGDYGGIGRGCADPTGGMAKSQSGISPLTFLRVLPVVESCNLDQDLIDAAINISDYEKLPNHNSAIKNINNESTSLY